MLELLRASVSPFMQKEYHFSGMTFFRMTLGSSFKKSKAVDLGNDSLV